MKVTIDLDAPLYDFYKAGIIQRLYIKGNPPAIYYNYYECFLKHQQSGKNRTESASLASDECRTSTMTIWRAIKAIEQ